MPLRFPCRGDVAFAQAIKPDRVVAEHFIFEIVTQFPARHQVGQVSAELITLALVRKVGGRDGHLVVCSIRSSA